MIVIGSRGSDLALWQAHHVKARLEATGQQVEIKVIKTQGDRIQHLSFDKMEGKGFFTKELEEELLAGTIDLAVHSHKDLPTEHPEGLTIAAVSEREDPADMLLIIKGKEDTNATFHLPKGAVVGTSSARRKSQLLLHCPHIELKDLRGNVPTRIQKLREGQYDAIMMACAGAERLELDLSEFHMVRMDPKQFVPAPAQGVLALQIREGNDALRETLQVLHDNDVAERLAVERRILNLFQGGCQLPLGSYCEKHNGVLKVWTAMSREWNSPVILDHSEGTDAEALAQQVVASLKAKS
ncbi:MAG: hydroxymethylbilane synthase [Flavobacteriales bacterium]|nr:hydroxymethylbilane synthase [Flavobacteriales bacterium]